MNIKFAPSVLALALSINDADASAKVASIVDGVASLELETEDFGSANNRSGGRVEKSVTESKGVDPAHVIEKPILDVGILERVGRRTLHRNRIFPDRRLQRTDTGLTEYACENPESLCEPDLCVCVNNGGDAYQCSSELNAVCNGLVNDNDGTPFTIGGCVGESNVAYYENLYCPFAKCLVGGDSFESCDCAFYETSCDIYGDDPLYRFEKDTLEHCARADCCKNKTDDMDRRGCLDEFDTDMPVMSPVEGTESAPEGSGGTGNPQGDPDPTGSTPSGVGSTPVGETNGSPAASPTTGSGAKGVPAANAPEAPNGAGSPTSWGTSLLIVAALAWSLSV